MTPTHSIAEVGDRYGLTVDQVIRKCRINGWPHRRPNRRKAATWLFTDEDIAAIDDLIAERGPSVDSWGRERRPV